MTVYVLTMVDYNFRNVIIDIFKEHDTALTAKDEHEKENSDRVYYIQEFELK
jgi:hypothetical protein